MSDRQIEMNLEWIGAKWLQTQENMKGNSFRGCCESEMARPWWEQHQSQRFAVSPWKWHAEHFIRWAYSLVFQPFICICLIEAHWPIRQSLPLAECRIQCPLVIFCTFCWRKKEQQGKLSICLEVITRRPHSNAVKQTGSDRWLVPSSPTTTTTTCKLPHLDRVSSWG